MSESVDITAVRTKLYHQGTDYLNRRRHYFKVMNQEAGLDKTGEKVELGEPGVVASWMYEALVSAGTFQWTLSAVLRLLEQESPGLAAKAAEIVEYVQDAGIEAIEGANDDLPDLVATDAKAEDDRIEAERVR